MRGAVAIGLTVVGSLALAGLSVIPVPVQAEGDSVDICHFSEHVADVRLSASDSQTSNRTRHEAACDLSGGSVITVSLDELAEHGIGH